MVRPGARILSLTLGTAAMASLLLILLTGAAWVASRKTAIFVTQSVGGIDDMIVTVMSHGSLCRYMPDGVPPSYVETGSASMESEWQVSVELPRLLLTAGFASKHVAVPGPPPWSGQVTVVAPSAAKPSIVRIDRRSIGRRRTFEPRFSKPLPYVAEHRGSRVGNSPRVRVTCVVVHLEQFSGWCRGSLRAASVSESVFSAPSRSRLVNGRDTNLKTALAARILSLILGIAWLRVSCWHEYQFQAGGGPTIYQIDSTALQGSVNFSVDHPVQNFEDPRSQPDWLMSWSSTWYAPDDRAHPPLEPDPLPRFRIEDAVVAPDDSASLFGPGPPPVPKVTGRRWVVPYWFLLLVTAVLPARTVVAAVRRRRRIKAGFCQGCGYDLRASADRCPECGRAIVCGPALRNSS